MVVTVIVRGVLIFPEKLGSKNGRLLVHSDA